MEAAPQIENAPPAFHLLAKPTGATCNLDCTYCFFLSKEMLYPGSRFRMADELLEKYIQQLPNDDLLQLEGEISILSQQFGNERCEEPQVKKNNQEIRDLYQ